MLLHYHNKQLEPVANPTCTRRHGKWCHRPFMGTVAQKDIPRLRTAKPTKAKRWRCAEQHHEAQLHHTNLPAKVTRAEEDICVCTPATKFAGACIRKPSHMVLLHVNAGYRENRNGPVRSRCRRPQRKSAAEEVRNNIKPIKQTTLKNTAQGDERSTPLIARHH